VWCGLAIILVAGCRFGFEPSIDGAADSIESDPSLVLAFDFDDSGDGTVHDRSSYANDGLLIGSPSPSYGAGVHGTGLVFDRAPQYVVIADSPSIDIQGPELTISFWLSLSGTNPTGGGDYVIVAKPWLDGVAGDPPYQFGVEFDYSDAKTLDFYIGDTTLTSHVASTPAPTDVAMHVAFTLDGFFMREYRDGVLQHELPVSASVAMRGEPLVIGADYLRMQQFAGMIDDMRIYRRALSLAEIRSDMMTPVR
jgi:hypothetical protein